MSTAVTQELPKLRSDLVISRQGDAVVLKEPTTGRFFRRYRGASGMQRWVGLGVLANDLLVLARAGP